MALRRESAKERAKREAEAAAAAEQFKAELIAGVSEHRKAKARLKEVYQYTRGKLVLNQGEADETMRQLVNAIQAEVMLRMRIAGMVACLPADEGAMLLAAGGA